MGNKLIVKKAFDYRFPSGCLVALKPCDKAITVKREIVEYALAKGYGWEPQTPTQPYAPSPMPK